MTLLSEQVINKTKTDYNQRQGEVMFRLAKEELEKLGASITAKEIFQQPGLWQEAYQLYVSQLEAIESFLSGIKKS